MSALPSEFLPLLGTPPSGQSKIQAIFSLAGSLVLADDFFALSFEQQRAIRHISACRTAESGFNLEVCGTCGYQNLHYNSCGDRNCPVCQGVKKEIWVDQRSSEVIDCAYYHAVFTCPHELNPLFLANKKLLYSMFHRCVGRTIVELAQDPAYLWAVPGVIQILHTWNQDLLCHILNLPKALSFFHGFWSQPILQQLRYKNNFHTTFLYRIPVRASVQYGKVRCQQDHGWFFFIVASYFPE